MTEDNNRKIIR